MTSEECLLCLHRSGWSLGEHTMATTAGIVYVVEGSNGENLLRAWGDTSALAWQRACWQAEAVGMLRREVTARRP